MSFSLPFHSEMNVGSFITADKITDTICTIVISSQPLLPSVQRTPYVCSLCSRRFDLSPLCRCMGTQLPSSHFSLNVRTLHNGLVFLFLYTIPGKKNEESRMQHLQVYVCSVKMSRLFKSLFSIAISFPACQTKTPSLNLQFVLASHCMFNL